MRRSVVAFLFILLAISLSSGQAAPSASQAARTASAAPDAAPHRDAISRGAFPMTLTKALDSKKLKDGNIVICHTSGVLHLGSGMMIPSGAKVIGHITQAKARSKGDSESSLAMVFDKIEVAKGKEIPMKGTLQAVGPSLGSNSGPDTGEASPGTLPTGHTGNVTAMPPPTQGAVAGPNSGIHTLNLSGSHPLLNAESTGVLGIKNLEMSKDAVLTSSGKEVKLDSGTQMLVRAEIEIPVQ